MRSFFHTEWARNSSENFKLRGAECTKVLFWSRKSRKPLAGVAKAWRSQRHWAARKQPGGAALGMKSEFAKLKKPRALARLAAPKSAKLAPLLPSLAATFNSKIGSRQPLNSRASSKQPSSPEAGFKAAACSSLQAQKLAESNFQIQALAARSFPIQKLVSRLAPSATFEFKSWQKATFEFKS